MLVSKIQSWTYFISSLMFRCLTILKTGACLKTWTNSQVLRRGSRPTSDFCSFSLILFLILFEEEWLLGACDGLAVCDRDLLQHWVRHAPSQQATAHCIYTTFASTLRQAAFQKQHCTLFLVFVYYTYIQVCLQYISIYWDLRQAAFEKQHWPRCWLLKGTQCNTTHNTSRTLHCHHF